MSPAGLAASSLAGSDVITYDGHGFETGSPLSVRACEDGELSAPLVAGTTYYAIRLSNSTLKLSATPSGSAIDLTSDAVSMMLVREPNFDLWIEFYSRWVEPFLPANAVPMGRHEPVHPLVRGVVADLCAKRMFNVGGQASDTIKEMQAASVDLLKELARGLALRGAPTTAPTTLTTSSTLLSVPDTRGWKSRTLP